MYNIKGFGRLTNFISKKIAHINRSKFIKNCSNWQVDVMKMSCDSVNLDVISVSGSNYFAEQLLSIYSFIKYIGVPHSWLVLDDGSYSDSQLVILSNFEFVSVVKCTDCRFVKFPELLALSNSNISITIMHALYNLLDEIQRTTVFIEADVLIGKKFNDYIHLFFDNNWYLPDSGPHFDLKYFNFETRKMFDINNGFTIFNQRPDSELIISYLKDSIDNDVYEYFTPQGATQLSVNYNRNSFFLDPRYFIVSVSDMFKLCRDFSCQSVALRHFVGPCRHKMWQYNW
jgi:hypothetical protein